MTEEEIKKQLEVKNKEIYLKKLNLDLINNTESLMLSLGNLLDKVNDSAIHSIIGIAESFREQENIKNDVDDFFDKFQNELISNLDNKNKNIKDLLKNSNHSYKEYLQKENDKLNNKLFNYYTNNINILSNKIQSYYEDSFCNKRINNYLTNTLKDTLLDKINDTIKSRDLILLNTFNETYLKYLELNKNTIG